MTQDLIPTFEPGQMVIYHQKECEFWCPCCGKLFAEDSFKRDYICEIIGKPKPIIYCKKCRGGFSTPEGWYKLYLVDYGETGVAPYTLLEKIQEDGG